SYGYNWSQKIDQRSGLLIDSTDINGTRLQRPQDDLFRPTSLVDATVSATPVTLVTAAYLTNFAVSQGQPISVVVTQKPAGSPDLATKTFVDGWGRIIQTVKPGSVDNGSGTA